MDLIHLYFRIWFIALAILIVSIDLRHFFMYRYEEAIHWIQHLLL